MPLSSHIHLTCAHSDHFMLLLKVYGTKMGGLGVRSFRFQAAWLLHEDFLKWMEEWAWNSDLTSCLKSFCDKLKAWNKDTFRNIFRIKERSP